MVELRTATHMHSYFHYIRAIKHGSTKIVVNVDAKGKTKLRFRQLVDVYNRDSVEDGEPVPRVVRDLDNGSEGSCPSGGETEDFEMTLDTVRRQCKGKKRKCRKRKVSEIVSNVEVKEELVTEDERCDFDEPLINLNTKFSKRRKKKQERKTKCVSTSSSSEEKVDLPLLCDVKAEAWDDSYSVSEGMDLVANDPLLDSNPEPESTTMSTELVDRIMCDSSKDTRLAPYSLEMVAVEETMTTKPVEESVKDASEEFDNVLCGNVSREETEPEPTTSTELLDGIMSDSSEDTRLAPYSLEMVAVEEPMTTNPVEESAKDASEEFSGVLSGNASSEEAELEAPLTSEPEDIGCVKNFISSDTCSESEEVKEDEGSNDSKPDLDMAITGFEIVKVETPDVVASDYSSLPIPDIGIEDTEFMWETEDLAKDDLPEATDITNCCDSLDKLHLVPDDSTISLEEHRLSETSQEQPASSRHVDEAEDHESPQLYTAPVEVEAASETDSIQPQKQPEKLLSGRKALSPTSQAKLRKAMEHPDLPEKKIQKSKGKLYFSPTSHRILKAEGLDNIVDRVEVIPITRPVTQNANNNTRPTQYQRALRKLPRRDIQATKQQPFSTGSTSIQGCTEKAISFSQGQMDDFQYVAAKLTKELKSMRLIAKRCLLAESNTSNMSEDNLDEVKSLIGNAEKTEEISKKWLSMIERDCNRFCKLMGMVKEEKPTTENSVEKKKKIRFADDAGGVLCQVKVFEIDLESEL